MSARDTQHDPNENPPGCEPGGEKCCVPFNLSRLQAGQR